MKKLIKFIIKLFIIIFLVELVYLYFIPKKYDDIIDKYSSEYNVDRSLVKAVIFKESRFKETAVSSKGAIGLMQLMPSTALWLMNKLKIEDYKIESADNNIRLGTYYLSYLMNLMDSDEEHALLAYNAGPENAKRWVNSEGYSKEDMDNYVDFNETRKYVREIKLTKNIISFMDKYGIFLGELSNLLEDYVR
ncbi:lytic transglycosylase domain-containing protein [Fenollaria massiliensis]|uniref:Lytic transglycosylase domain-containing protein n=1 Tax=Fenollaria massiliensis TaxID=938288 RepID=A0A9E7DI56_9FIRM|nr:lytic transglycosylase domain-containing protein [Fenollaria massiliensis]UQK58563.1 lytic transglycosylase domain-containing protein [Fenollaria massiliensis]